MVVRGGDVIAMDATIRIDRRLHLRGRGELRFVGGVEAAPALKLIVSGSSVTGVRVSYAGPTASSTGERNTAISIWASDVLIDGVTVDGFQNGIAVQPSGEFEGVVISGCHVLNIVGSGGGRGSASSAGEDRGDGITVWGARSAVVGNIVSAAPEPTHGSASTPRTCPTTRSTPVPGPTRWSRSRATSSPGRSAGP